MFLRGTTDLSPTPSKGERVIQKDNAVLLCPFVLVETVY